VPDRNLPLPADMGDRKIRDAERIPSTPAAAE
jgi:hypothetical protein